MATSPTEADVAARLIERLLADPSFRARFRRDPAATAKRLTKIIRLVHGRG